MAQDKTDAVAWLVGNDKVSPKQNEDNHPWYLGENRYHDHQIQQIIRSAKNFVDSGNLPLAETMYRQALELSPSNSRILYLLGKVLNAMDSLEQALDLMNQALSYSSQNALIHAELGEIYRKMNKPHEAMAHLMTGVELSPDSSMIHQTMARFFASHHQLERSVSHYRTCLTTDPSNQDAMLEVADVYEKLGRHGHAMRQYKRALELSATAIVLVHNHPSGDPTPSRADIEMTKQIVAAAKPLGVVIHDHIIVGKQGHASFRGLGLI